jgi:hypothetical protein
LQIAFRGKEVKVKAADALGTAKKLGEIKLRKK